jgi:hypothetical protein
MKILGSCSQCTMEVFATDPQGSLGDAWEAIPKVMLDVEGDAGYRFECPKGHANAFCLNVPPHELLFESGCLSLVRGAFREAVGSFAASRERFLELCLRVEAKHAGADQDLVERAWGHLASRSERQLGASIWADLLIYRRVSENAKEAGAREAFRNRVIHHGVFPTQEEAVAFARELFTFVRSRDGELRSERREARHAVLTGIWLRAAQRLVKDGHVGSVGGQAYATVLSGDVDDFDSALTKFKELNPFARWHEDVTVAEVAARLNITVYELLTRWLMPTLIEGKGGDAPAYPETEVADDPEGIALNEASAT